MKQTDSLPRAIMLCLLFAVHGCISVSSSPSPRFYALRALDGLTLDQRFSVPAGLIIGLGPVSIPEYLNRPHIVTRTRDNLLVFAQFDRWGEPLEAAIAGVIHENLAEMLPGAVIERDPWNIAIPVRYQVVLDILRLESELDKEVYLAAQWSVINTRSRKLLFTKRSEFRQPVTPHTYAGLSAAVSGACASLSREIAQFLASVSGKEMNKGE